jgi:omega-6 fatty acid desaturase (delta-12 desaturase)
MVIAYPLIQVLAIVGLHGAGRPVGLLGDIVLCVLIPFLVFTWLIGFATYQHHTHPRVLWYRDENEWSFFRAQVQSTVHVEFPRWIELALNNIMEHTAHHVDPKVPLYRLTDAQDAIETAFGSENVITERFSFAKLSATLRTCQLYDFDDHCWLSFDGQRTTPPRRLSLELR